MLRTSGLDKGACCVGLLLVASCGGYVPATSPPPAKVRVVTVAATPVANLVEVPGRVQAVRKAEVRGRVYGIVQRQFYTEGSDVTEGQQLFLIRPRPTSRRRARSSQALA